MAYESATLVLEVSIPEPTVSTPMLEARGSLQVGGGSSALAPEAEA